MFQNLSERNKIIRQEIPDGDYSYGKQLRKIKVLFIFTYQYPKNKRVDTQSDNRDREKLRKFHEHFRIIAVKSPDTV